MKGKPDFLPVFGEAMGDRFWARVLIGILVLVIGFSLITLSNSPLPWFDEVFFADLSHSYLHKGGLYLKFSPIFNKSEFSFYGPVYFWIQSAIAYFLDFRVFSFRMVNFMSGMIFFYLLWNYFRRLEMPGIFLIFSLTLLVSDPIVQFNLHSGRMDFVALSLSMAGLISFMKFTEQKSYSFFILSASFFSLSYLTTPRILFFLIPVFVYIFLLFRREFLAYILILAALASIPIFYWIYSRFGDPVSYVKAFMTNVSIANHIGPNRNSYPFYRYNQYIIWYSLLILSICWQIYNWISSRRINPHAVFFILSIVLYNYLVVEKGPYSAMVISFYAGLIFLTWQEIRERKFWNGVYQFALGVNLLFFAGIFILKTSLSLANRCKSSESDFKRQLPAPILQGKKVVGSFEYFYSLNSLGCQFYGFQLGTLPERIHYHFKEIDFDYLLLSNKDVKSHQFIEYQAGGKLEKIATLEMPDTKSARLARLVAARLHTELPDYSGVLFRRVK